jgi:hypothetical protein
MCIAHAQQSASGRHAAEMAQTVTAKDLERKRTAEFAAQTLQMSSNVGVTFGNQEVDEFPEDSRGCEALEHRCDGLFYVRGKAVRVG